MAKAKKKEESINPINSDWDLNIEKTEVATTSEEPVVIEGNKKIEKPANVMTVLSNKPTEKKEVNEKKEVKEKKVSEKKVEEKNTSFTKPEQNFISDLITKGYTFQDIIKKSVAILRLPKEKADVLMKCRSIKDIMLQL